MTSAAAPRLVCLIGAECTGKTTLAKALAQHIDGLYVAEALRQFCDQHGRTPTPSEQAGLTDAQVAQEERAWVQARQHGKRFVFCDTAPLLTAVYSENYFADRSLYAHARALHQRYALTLLLEPDLPWVADGLQRDGVVVQARVHALLVQALAGVQSVAFVTGRDEARRQCALAAIESACGFAS